MSNTDISPVNVIRTVQEKRLALLNNPGEGIDKDMLMLMRDMAKTSMDEMRLVQEDENAKTDQEIARAMVKATATGKNPFVSEGTKRDVAVEVDDSDIGELTLVEGETSTEKSNTTYNEFMTDKDA
jgi:UDP-N-acetylmuramyl tripeptide synthase